MNANLDDKESSMTRIEQLEHAGLEQEIENLKNKLSSSTKENVNLKEELAEAYRIKTQLADLLHVEASKHVEAEKQVKFFQGCVAAAFAERDHSIMEAEKAKEKEEFMSEKFNEIQNRLEKMSSDCLEQTRQNDELQLELAKQEEQNETFKQVINKFYEIRQQFCEVLEDTSWGAKCACLLHDSVEMWSYNDDSVSKYISALEENLETARKSVNSLQSRLRMGLDIENHLKRRFHELEKHQILVDKRITNAVAGLRLYHSQHKVYVMNLLNEGKSHIKMVAEMVEEKVRQSLPSREQDLEPSQSNDVVNIDEGNCRDVHMNTDAIPVLAIKRDDYGPPAGEVQNEGLVSEALTQAMKEKVAALLLLSQQEERHLLEKNVNLALEKKIKELQRNLLQVTNEKVKALMELAHLKQDYRQLQEKFGNQMKQVNPITDPQEIFPFDHERDGRLRNLLKRTYLRRWIGVLDNGGNATEANLKTERSFSSRKASDIDYASMKIENATLRESMGSMEHLTSSIHRLHLALLKAKESVTCESTLNSSEVLDEIIFEAKLVKTALGSSLPVSWSAEGDEAFVDEFIRNGPGDAYGDASSEKLDHVTAAGFEMVELLILAAQILKDNASIKSSQEAS